MSNEINIIGCYPANRDLELNEEIIDSLHEKLNCYIFHRIDNVNIITHGHIFKVGDNIGQPIIGMDFNKTGEEDQTGYYIRSKEQLNFDEIIYPPLPPNPPIVTFEHNEKVKDQMKILKSGFKFNDYIEEKNTNSVENMLQQQKDSKEKQELIYGELEPDYKEILLKYMASYWIEHGFVYNPNNDLFNEKETEALTKIVSEAIRKADRFLSS